MNNNKMKQQKQTRQMMSKPTGRKWLLFAISTFSTCFVMTSVYASDVEIYRQGTDGGNNTIMLMVDLSQSMGADPIADLQRDYPLCVSGSLLGNVTGLVNQVVKVKVDLANLVKLDTTTSVDSASCYIPSTLVIQILEGVDGITSPVLGADLIGLRGSVQYIKDSCELVENPPLEIVGPAYRCYNRLHRIKQAVHDVIDGNADKGIEALPDNISVGISVFPALNQAATGKNELAGMIAVEAGKLNAAQRTKIKAKIDEITSVNPTGSITGKVNQLVGKLLALDLVGLVVGALGDIPALIGDLKNLAGMSTPTATAYAETGAYLLGNTTKGTGALEIGRVQKVELSIFGLGLLTIGKYQECSIYDEQGKCATWSATTTQDASILGGLGGRAPAWYKNTCLGTNRSNCHDFPTTATSLIGLELNQWKSFYRYNDDPAYASAYSGFPVSVTASKTGHRYKKPALPEGETQCGANGLYVLTGSIPNLDTNLLDGLLGGASREPFNTSNNPVAKLMSRSLDSSSSTVFNCGNVPSGWANGSNSATWNCIANYAGALKDGTYNNGLSIKTGVGGIGRDFAHIPNAKTAEELGTIKAPTTVLSGVLGAVGSLLNALDSVLGLLGLNNLTNKLTRLLENVLPVPLDPNHNADVANLARWGIYGGGGWYQLSDSKSIAESIVDFSQNLSDIEADPFMGLQTTPADPLTPFLMSNDVYNSMFEPTDHQSWFGNLKKYSVTNATAGDNVIRMVDWKDKWNSEQVEDQQKNTKLFTGGMLDQLKTLRPTKADASTRKLWINRSCKTDGTFAESTSLKKVTIDYLNDSSEARCTTNATAKDSYGGYLMNLLGYKLDNPASATGNSLTQSEPLWQVGMPLHSTPLKITQDATFNANGSITRDDYVVFGSTQGLLHVLDASNGKEKLAFVPNEMLENEKQRDAFTSKRQGNWKDMPYGIDGAWTAYTEYVYGMKDGKVVATVGQVTSGTDKPKGKQVLYGGLRMGGRSYYALDLTDIDNPALKFHINPTGDCSSSNPLGCMGQSWSKPTIAYVNWKGVRKQVMFVGGGYDATGATTACNSSDDNTSRNLGYECKDYDQTNKKGAGVYMFDANNGDLLWWASASATNKNDTAKENALNVTNMSYSVVSRINTADRNGDGLVDHLYFGDLGGQVWRVDINTNNATGDFAKRATRILNLHKTDGTSPRFYDAPSFSVYGYEQPLAVVSIASGNRSLPASDPSSGAIYNIFDRDVTKTNLYALAQDTLETQDIDLTTANKSLGAMQSLETVTGKSLAEVKALIPNGWTTAFDHGKKVMDEMAVINKNLYASVYDPGDTPSCPVQVRGETQIHRYCLPFGVCEQNITTQVTSFAAGKGIVALNVGAGSTDSQNQLQSRALINSGSASSTAELPANKMRRQLVPLKWYERNE